MGGSRYERQLVNALDATGYVAMKAPSSGSATERELPDILALRAVECVAPGGPPDEYRATTRAEALALELKSTKATTAYAEDTEITALERFATAAGARPVLAAKFKRPGGARSPFYLVAPEDARMTDSGNYGIPEADATDRAFALVYTATDTEPARFETLE